MFKRDDIVVSQSGETYKILIKIPAKDEYDVLKMSTGKLERLNRCNILGIYKEKEKCPACKTPWTVTFSPVLNTKWEDCIKCNKTKEDILSKEAVPPPLFKEEMLK